MFTDQFWGWRDREGKGSNRKERKTWQRPLTFIDILSCLLLFLSNLLMKYVLTQKPFSCTVYPLSIYLFLRKHCLVLNSFLLLSSFFFSFLEKWLDTPLCMFIPWEESYQHIWSTHASHFVKGIVILWRLDSWKRTNILMIEVKGITVGRMTDWLTSQEPLFPTGRIPNMNSIS